MFRKFVCAAMLSGAVVSTGFTQTLDSICAIDAADSILSGFQSLDTTGGSDSLAQLANSLTATGDCDSATINMVIAIGPVNLPMPLVTFSKLNSCSLSINYSDLMGTIDTSSMLSDTVIDVCILGVRPREDAGRSVVAPSVRVDRNGSLLSVSGPAIAGADRVVVRFFDQRGRCVRTLVHPGNAQGSAVWTLAGPIGAFLCTIEAGGRTLGTVELRPDR